VTHQKLTIIGSSKSYWLGIPSNINMSGIIRGWFVSSLATVGWLLALLGILSLLEPGIAKNYVDPLVYWASRLGQ
jgi:hypothetical protein